MKRRLLSLTCLLSGCLALPAQGQNQGYDLAILNGRVMDPESGLDAVCHLGIAGGTIVAVSEAPLAAKFSVDAAGLTVAPGFIDLHQHSWDEESLAFKACDGVTSILELEVGTADIDQWYADRAGRMPIHYGASIGHIPVRMKVMNDFPGFLPPADSGASTRVASDAELEQMKEAIEYGLKRGAPAVGFGLQYTPAASRWEVLELFRIASRYHAPCHVHMRFKGDTDPGGVQGLMEVIAAGAVSGAPLHIVHINSTGGGFTPQLIEIIAEARARGSDISVECYPYTAGMTDISSAIFDEGFRERIGVDYGDLQWGATGERLTAETFAKYRETGGLVIVHSNPESIVAGAVASPITMIASDGLKGHPRNCGTFARILGKYVREEQKLTLMDAIRKSSYLPARRLEVRVPAMKRKGRIRPGADADLVVFDPDAVIDKATFTDALQFSEGITHVFVAGTPVVKDGEFVPGVYPGQAVRAPVTE